MFILCLNLLNFGSKPQRLSYVTSFPCRELGWAPGSFCWQKALVSVPASRELLFSLNPVVLSTTLSWSKKVHRKYPKTKKERRNLTGNKK